MSDEALIAAVSRCIDGDLDRAERLALLSEIAAHPRGLDVLREALVLEAQLADLAGAYDEIPLPAALREAPVATAQPRRRRGLLRAAASPRARHLWTAVASAAAAAIVVVLFLPQQDLRLAEHAAVEVERITVLDIPFQTAADAAGWSQSLHLEPGQSARVEVQQADTHDFHLRISGGGDLDVTLVHSRTATADQSRRLKGGAVRYAALRAPHAGDVVVVRNDGKTAVSLDVGAPRPEAVLLKRVERQGA